MCLLAFVTGCRGATACNCPSGAAITLLVVGNSDHLPRYPVPTFSENGVAYTSACSDTHDFSQCTTWTFFVQGSGTHDVQVSALSFMAQTLSFELEPMTGEAPCDCQTLAPTQPLPTVVTLEAASP